MLLVEWLIEFILFIANNTRSVACFTRSGWVNATDLNLGSRRVVSCRIGCFSMSLKRRSIDWISLVLNIVAIEFTSLC